MVSLSESIKSGSGVIKSRVVSKLGGGTGVILFNGAGDVFKFSRLAVITNPVSLTSWPTTAVWSGAEFFKRFLMLVLTRVDSFLDSFRIFGEMNHEKDIWINLYTKLIVQPEGSQNIFALI